MFCIFCSGTSECEIPDFKIVILNVQSVLLFMFNYVVVFEILNLFVSTKHMFYSDDVFEKINN